ARFTAAGEPDPLAVGDPRRDPDGEPAGLGDPAGAAALRALLLDDGADPLALPARLGQAERTLVPGDQPGAAAVRAGAGPGARLGTAAVAGVADPRRPQRQRHRGPVHRVGEVER